MSNGDTGLKPPYLNLYQTIGNKKVYVVDGDYIRDHQDPNFTNFGQSGGYDYIPKNEYWIDQSTSQKEYPYYIMNMGLQDKFQAQGMGYDKALAQADELEHQARIKAEGSQIPDVHKSFMGNVPGTNVKIWLVNGDAVRTYYDSNYTEGGHDMVYKYIPPREIWMDDENEPAEQGFDLLHEAYERAVMLTGTKYDDAHNSALKVEKKARDNPNLLHLLFMGAADLNRRNDAGTSRFQTRPPGSPGGTEGKVQGGD